MFSLSGYATFANNPIHYTDPLGDEVDGDAISMGHVNTWKTYTEDRVRELKEISERNEDQTEELNELQNALNEYSVLEDSKQLYWMDIRDDSNVSEGNFKPALVKRNGETVHAGVVTIHLVGEVDNLKGAIAHELKHADQYENGQYIPGFNDWSYWHEIEAYTREFYYGGLLRNDMQNHVTNISEITDVFVAWRGRTKSKYPYRDLKNTSTSAPQVPTSKNIEEWRLKNIKSIKLMAATISGMTDKNFILTNPDLSKYGISQIYPGCTNDIKEYFKQNPYNTADFVPTK